MNDGLDPPLDDLGTGPDLDELAAREIEAKERATQRADRRAHQLRLQEELIARRDPLYFCLKLCLFALVVHAVAVRAFTEAFVVHLVVLGAIAVVALVGPVRRSARRAKAT